MPDDKAEFIRVRTEHQGGFDVLEATFNNEGRQIQVTGWLSPESGLDGIHAVFAGVVHLDGRGDGATGHPRGRMSRTIMLLRRMVLEREGDRMRVTLAGDVPPSRRRRGRSIREPAERTPTTSVS